MKIESIGKDIQTQILYISKVHNALVSNSILSIRKVLESSIQSDSNHFESLQILLPEKSALIKLFSDTKSPEKESTTDTS